MQGQLFTSDFLTDGIKDTPVWKQLDDAALDAFITRLRVIYGPFKADSHLNEAATEDEIIVKVLDGLDWVDYLRQQSASGTRREDVPDVLLFPDAVAKTAALKEKKDDRRYRHGIVVLESKRWSRPLDRGEATDRLDPGTPSNRILRYLSAVEVASERAIRWGILTNGAQWRLYFQGARSRSEEFWKSTLRHCSAFRAFKLSLRSATTRATGSSFFFAFFTTARFLRKIGTPNAAHSTTTHLPRCGAMKSGNRSNPVRATARQVHTTESASQSCVGRKCRVSLHSVAEVAQTFRRRQCPTPITT